MTHGTTAPLTDVSILAVAPNRSTTILFPSAGYLRRQCQI